MGEVSSARLALFPSRTFAPFRRRGPFRFATGRSREPFVCLLPEKTTEAKMMKAGGTEIGKTLAEKSRGLFSANDWQCKTYAAVTAGVLRSACGAASELSAWMGSLRGLKRSLLSGRGTELLHRQVVKARGAALSGKVGDAGQR